MKKNLLLQIILFLSIACFSVKGMNHEGNNHFMIPDSHICGNYLSDNQNTIFNAFQDNSIEMDEEKKHSDYSTPGELYKPDSWSSGNDYSIVNDVKAMQIIPDGESIQGESRLNTGGGFFFLLILSSLYFLFCFHSKKKE